MLVTNNIEIDRITSEVANKKTILSASRFNFLIFKKIIIIKIDPKREIILEII